MTNEMKSVSLEEVSNIIMGQSPDSEYYNEEGYGYPFLQGCANFTSKYPRAEVYCSVPSKIAPKDSILISVRAPVGDLNLSDREYCIGRGLASIVPTNIDMNYLFYSINLNKRDFYRISQGSTFDAVNSQDLKQFKILVPLDIKKEKRISQIILTVERSIENTEKLIEKYKNIKQGLMQDLLTGKVRVKSGIQTEEVRFKESTIGLLPEDWNDSYLSDYCDIQGGYAFESKDYSADGIQLIRIGSLFNNELNLDRDPVFLPYEFKRRYIDYVIKPNDIVISMTGTIGKRDYGFAVKIPYMNKEFMLNQRVGKFIIKEGIDKDYLFYLLHSDYYLSALYTRAGGTKQANLTSKQILQIKVAVPEIEEQKAIANILNAQEAIIESEQAHLGKLKLLKQGLMQDLLTGKVRVKVEGDGDE